MKIEFLEWFFNSMFGTSHHRMMRSGLRIIIASNISTRWGGCGVRVLLERSSEDVDSVMGGLSV